MGNYNSRFLYSTYTLVSWAVPVFLMITGALLLNLNRIVDETKIRKYLSRMFRILLIFGGVCSCGTNI